MYTHPPTTYQSTLKSHTRITKIHCIVTHAKNILDHSTDPRINNKRLISCCLVIWQTDDICVSETLLHERSLQLTVWNEVILLHDECVSYPKLLRDTRPTFDSSSLPRHNKHAYHYSRDGTTAETDDEGSPQWNLVETQHCNIKQWWHFISAEWHEQYLASIKTTKPLPLLSTSSLLRLPVQCRVTSVLTIVDRLSNLYTSRAYATMSVSICLTEVHWHIIANLGFKFRSKFTAHCGRGKG